MLGLLLLALVGAGDSLTVRWEAPADRCASTDEVRERLLERLGPRIEAHGRVELDGEITPHEGGLRLRLRVVADDEQTERVLEAPVCEELLDAAILITSLTVGGEPLEPEQPPPAPERPEPATAEEPPLVPERPEPSVEEPPPAPEQPEPVADAPAPEQPETTEPGPEPPDATEPPPRARFLHGAARAGAGAEGGQLPGIGAFVTAGASLHGRRWLARLDLSYAPRRRALLPGFTDRGVLVQAWYVSLDGGLRWPLSSRVHLPATLGLDLGALHGNGFGVPVTTTRAQPWVAPAASLGLDVELVPRVGLWLAGRASVPLVRPAFEIVGRGTAFRVAPAAVRAAAGITINWK